MSLLRADESGAGAITGPTRWVDNKVAGGAQSYLISRSIDAPVECGPDLPLGKRWLDKDGHLLARPYQFAVADFLGDGLVGLMTAGDLQGQVIEVPLLLYDPLIGGQLGSDEVG